MFRLIWIVSIYVRSFMRFSKGDSFVAEGYLHEYTYERDGQATDGVDLCRKEDRSRHCSHPVQRGSESARSIADDRHVGRVARSNPLRSGRALMLRHLVAETTGAKR